jgi:hypothetical protein
VVPAYWRKNTNTIPKSTRTIPKRRKESVIWNHQKIKKRVRPQNTIFSAEQSAIMTAIHSTIKESGIKLIATDSLSTLVAASDKKYTKIPKTWVIRKLLEQEGDKITLLWVRSHVGITGNEEAGTAAREALNENRRVPTTGLSELDNCIREQTGSKMRNRTP